MSVDQFIDRFGGWTESYFFFNNEVELRYDPKAHIYLLVKGDELEAQEGVTNVVHIIDKSEALVPWACKKMAEMLFKQAVITLPDGQKQLRAMSYTEFENLVLASKKAHEDAKNDAGDVGHIAHAWIERYIKAVIAHGPASLQVQETLAKFPEEERATNCCLAALDWMRAHNVRWLGTERKIYSRKYRYAGTMDGLCLVDSCSNPHCCKRPFKDRLTVSDWKTSNYLYVEYLLQTAAYMQAYNEEETYVAKVEQREARIAYDRWIIRLGKEDADFDPWYAPAEDFVPDLNGFLHALDTKRDVEGIELRVKNRAAETREAIRAERKALKEAAEKAERDRKDQERAKAKEERLEALKLRCKGADKYQGVRAPKCNGGEPCKACMERYVEVQNAKKAAKPTKTTKKRAKKVKPCDGDHGGPPCDNWNCWHRDPPPGCELFPQLLLPAPKPMLMLPAPPPEPRGLENNIAYMATWL